MYKDLLEVQIISPQKKVFEGKCSSVSSVNSVGPFDILPEHENFISLIRQYVSVVSNGEMRKFDIKDAVLKADSNQIHVFVGIESLA